MINKLKWIASRTPGNVMYLQGGGGGNANMVNGFPFIYLRFCSIPFLMVSRRHTMVVAGRQVQ